jgi:hypothetical protein
MNSLLGSVMNSLLGSVMNMGAEVFIWLAYTSSGIFLIKPLSIQKGSPMLTFLQCLKRKMATTFGRSAPTEYLCTHIHDLLYSLTL